MVNPKKQYYIIGLLGLLGLIVLGIIFFRERVAFADTAYQAVSLLIEQKPIMNWLRPGSMIPQVIPLAAIWMHAGLRTVMICHSISFLLFFLLIYLLAYWYSAQKTLFFVIPLYLVLITGEVFYWPQSELQQGMLWLCLYGVLLFEKKWIAISLPLNLCIHFLFILWVQFFHPLIFFPIVFLVIYYYDSEEQLFSRRNFFHLTACFIAFVIRKKVGMYDPYEKKRLDILTEIKANLPHFLSLDSVHVFIGKLTSVYLIYVLFLMVGVLWLAINKRYIKALCLVVFSLGYWALIMLASPVDARFYTENMLLPLAFIAALPVAADIIPSIRARYASLAFLLIIVVRLVYIYEAHADYTAHSAVYDPYIQYVRQNKLNGVFVDEKLIDQKKAIMSWASGYETILTTSLASPDSCIMVQTDYDPVHYDWALGADTSMVTVFGVWSKSSLPSRYFKLPGGKYEIVTKPL